MLNSLLSFLLGISELIVSILMLFATIIVAFFAYKLSKRQLNIQNYQLKHNLYERRYNIYVELKKGYIDDENFYSLLDIAYSIKDRSDGYTQWYNKYKDQLYFLFDDSVINSANLLKQKLQKAEPESSEKNPKKEIRNDIDLVYKKLRDEIGESLTFKNLK